MFYGRLESLERAILTTRGSIELTNHLRKYRSVLTRVELVTTLFNCDGSLLDNRTHGMILQKSVRTVYIPYLTFEK